MECVSVGNFKIDTQPLIFNIDGDGDYDNRILLQTLQRNILVMQTLVGTHNNIVCHIKVYK